MRPGASHCLAALLAVAVAAPAAAGSPERDLADQALERLAHGDAAGVASMLHQPPSYTPAQLGAETRAVTAGLAFLLGHFGAPEGHKLSKKPATFYGIVSAGGTLEYWSAATPLQSRSFVYAVKFKNSGNGFVKLDLVSFAERGPFQIRDVEFGLPADSADSKPSIVKAMRGLLALKGIRIPADFEDLADLVAVPQTALPANQE